MFENNDLGTKIKTIREQREMTISKLSELSNCPEELIIKLEAGKLIPSLTPLMKLSRALGVRLGTFLDDAKTESAIVHRKADMESAIHFSGNVSSTDNPILDFFALARNKSDRHMEPFIIDVHPPAYETTPLSTHEGEEFIYVLDGKLEIFYGKEVYTLEKGDSIYLDSIVPHDVHSTAGVETKILAVVFAPF